MLKFNSLLINHLLMIVVLKFHPFAHYSTTAVHFVGKNYFPLFIFFNYKEVTNYMFSITVIKSLVGSL